MKLTIHNVGHGSCISLLHENGNSMLWDCGHDGYNRPSVFLPKIGIKWIDMFFITNYDEDHISDLVNIKKYVSFLIRNKSINSQDLRSLKEKKRN